MKKKSNWLILVGVAVAGFLGFEWWAREHAAPAGYTSVTVAPGAGAPISLATTGGKIAFILPTGAKWAAQVAPDANWSKLNVTPGASTPGLFTTSAATVLALSWTDSSGAQQASAYQVA